MVTPAKPSPSSAISRSGCARLIGDWTVMGLGPDRQPRLADALRGAPPQLSVEFGQIGACDTVGVLAIMVAAGDRPDSQGLGDDPASGAARGQAGRRQRRVIAIEVGVRPPSRCSIEDLLDRLGRGVVQAGIDGYHTMGFMGHLIMVISRVVRDPRRIRWTACVSLAERAGLDAIPIVAVTTFFIGLVIAFLGANELEPVRGPGVRRRPDRHRRDAGVQRGDHRGAAGRGAFRPPASPPRRSGR